MSILNTTGYSQYIDTVLRAQGCMLFDHEGYRYLDFDAGVWCLALGHNHPKVVAALNEQMQKISHVGYRYSHPIVQEAAAALLRVAGMSDGKALFLSSGSEAVELAVQIVRQLRPGQKMLRFSQYYLSALGLSSNRNADQFVQLDWRTLDEEDDLERILPLDDIGLLVFEPGNASGLVFPPPKRIVETLVHEVQRRGALLIVDEVTTGIGRTGAWFGYQHYDIKPDLIACGKGLGNGYPISALIATAGLAKQVEEHSIRHAQSHQNDPLGCSALKAVLMVIEEEGLLDRAQRSGLLLQRKLEELRRSYPALISDVRCRGLMCALELKPLAGGPLAKLHRDLFEQGYLLGLNETGTVLRFYPPLIVSEAEIEEVTDALNDLLALL